MASYKEFRRQTAQRRRQRTLRRLLAFGVTACIILGLAWGITWGIETVTGANGASQPDSGSQQVQTGIVGSVLAPLPMENPVVDEANAVQFASVGPVKQTGDYTVTGLTHDMIALPECGVVDGTVYFAKTAFLGDSVTEGLDLYDNPAKGAAKVYGYRGASPSDIYNKVTLTRYYNDDQTVTEVPLELLVQNPPDQLYLMFGANALVLRDGEAAETAFLSYYGQMIDLLRESLGGVKLYIQSITPVIAGYDSATLTNERIQRVNQQLAQLSVEKNCYFVDVYAALTDENGALKAEYSADGLHMKSAGYKAWADYVVRHVAYDADNPYLPGSTYYREQS